MSTMGGTNDALMTRGRGSYANPHATIATKDVPTNIKQVMRLCRWYFTQDAMLGAIIDKMAEYPITATVIKERGDTKLTTRDRDRWDDILNGALNVRNSCKQMNIDEYIFGISARYLHVPFVRFVICGTCSSSAPIGSLRDCRVRPVVTKETFNLTATGWCAKCRSRRTFTIKDKKAEVSSGVSLARLNPLRMELSFNPLSSARIWYWSPPQVFLEGLRDSEPAIIETTEMKVLEAAFRNQRIRLNPNRLWITQADGMPGLWDGWGIPTMFRVLEDVYYYKILRRANEALAQEHVTPLRIMTPAGTGDISPQRTANLTQWQALLKSELHKFRRDPNHILLSPIPLNIEQMGGNARVMMVASEMEAAARVISMGIGCPIEMVWGGLNWSGASVSLRVLENHFLNTRSNSTRFLKWLVPRIASHYRLPLIDLDMVEFKMADDVQQQAQSINLMLQGFLSRESVLPEMGYTPREEFEHLTTEHDRLNMITMRDNIAAAHMNTIVQALEAKAQLLLQFEMQIVQQRLQAAAERQRLENLNAWVSELHSKGYTTPLEFDQSATILASLPPETQQIILGQWSMTMPLVTRLLTEKMQMGMMAQQNIAMAQGAAQGAQSAGAAQGAGMAPGAEGPYAGGVPEGPPSASAPGSAGQSPDGTGQPLPEQRPPQRDNSPI